jgi:hypothetical protein
MSGRSRRLVVGLTVLASALLVGALVTVAALGSPDISSAVILFPVLVLASLPILHRRAKLDADPLLFRLLVAALLLKLVGALVRYFVAYDVYEGVADAATYHDAGVHLADQFRSGIFDTGLDPLTGTNFIKLLTGVLYTVVGSAQLGGFLVFSWLAFWGLYLFYRAFTIAVPQGRARTYGLLVFFLPSLVFWPSGIGKESWMIFSLGIAAFGAAKALSVRTWGGLPLSALGLWAAAIVRPHVAGLLALALGAAYVIRPVRKELGSLGPIAKVAGVVTVSVLALVLVSYTDRFLEESAIDTGGGVTAVIRETTERTSQGGSGFEPSVLESPLRAPLAVVTVLFRPFLFEAHNVTAGAAALETTFLLVLSIVRIRWIWGGIRSFRRRPYVAMALVYTGLFVLAFSGFANFGLLARERVQLLPFFLVLLVIPPSGDGLAASPGRKEARTGA